MDEPLEDSLIRFFTHTSIMRDPLPSYDMVPDEVFNSLPPDPNIIELEARGTSSKTVSIESKAWLSSKRYSALAPKFARNVYSAVKLCDRSIGSTTLITA
jgi:hypothetical protein